MDSSSSSLLTPLQQELLEAFFATESGFFLTGGAALAGYWLKHRPTSDQPANPDPTTVDISITTDPSNATLKLDGVPVSNPFRASVARDSRQHTLLAKAEGFVEKEEVLVFDSARTVTLTLEAATASAKKASVGVRRGAPPAHPAAAATGATAAPPPAGQSDNGMPVVKKPILTLDSDNPFAPKP